MPAVANERTETITVNGQSESTLQPQFSLILAEVKTVHPKIETSYMNILSTLVKIINTLKEFGLTDKDIIKSIIRQGAEITWEN